MNHSTPMFSRAPLAASLRRIVLASSAALWVAGWPLPAAADSLSYLWMGLGATDNWTNPSNWDPEQSDAQFAPPKSLEFTTVYFDSSSATRFRVDLNENWSVKSLTTFASEFFGVRDRSFEFYSSNNSVLTLGDGGIDDDTVSADTISHAIALAADQLWVGHNLIVTGARSGAFTLNINARLQGCDRNGPCSHAFEGREGSVFLGGDGSAQTGDIHVWGGLVTLSGGDAISSQSLVVVHEVGTLDLLNSSEQLGALQGAGLVRIGFGALDVGIKRTAAANPVIDEFSGRLVGTGSFTKSGVGVMRLTGDNSGFTGAVNVNGGELQIGGSQDSVSNQSRVSIAAGATLRIQGDGETFGSLTGAGNLVADALTGVGTNNASTTFSGVLGGAGSFVKFGTGGLTLTGNNTHTGTVSVLSGDLNLLSGDNVSDASTVEVGASGRLLIDGDAESIGGLAGAGLVNIKQTLIVGANHGDSTFSGRLLGAGDFIKGGSGKLTLTGISEHRGRMSIEGGTLEVGGSVDTLSNFNAVKVAKGAKLRIAGNGEDFGSLGGAGAVELAANMGVGLDNSSTTFSGGLTGAGRFTKLGNGDMTLTGNSQLSGDGVVNAGKLALAANGKLDIGGVLSFGEGRFALTGGALSVHTINLNRGGFEFTGGELHVDTFIGNLANHGGTLAPGHSPGVSTVIGNYAQGAAATLEIELASDGAFDQLIVQNGSATLGGTLVVKLLDGFNPLIGSEFDFLLADGGIRGAFATMLFPQFANKHFELDSHLADRLTLRVVETPVPLPPAAVLLGGALLPLLRSRRARSRAPALS